MKKTPVKFKDAQALDIISVVYELWIETVPHLDPMTRGCISREWRKDNIRLMIPEDKIIQLT